MFDKTSIESLLEGQEQNVPEGSPSESNSTGESGVPGFSHLVNFSAF